MQFLWQYLPKSLVVTIGLVLLLEGFVYVRTQDTPGNIAALLENRFYPPNRIPALEESIIQWQVYHGLSVKQPVDILLMGDSSALMGLRPAIIQARTGLTAWDIGTLDYLSTPGNVDLLELFLQQQPTPPKVIVYHIVSWSFSLSRKSLAEIGYLERFQKWVSVLAEAKKAGLDLVLPSMQYRRTAQRLLTTFAMQEKEEWLNAPRGPYPSDNEIRAGLFRNQGAMTEVVREDGVDQWRDLRPMLRIEPSIVSEIRRLMALCARYSIRLVLMTNPIPDVSATPENLQGLAALEAELKQMAQEYRQVTFYAPFARFYPVALCNSYNHLTETGAARNSAELSRWLIDLLDLKAVPAEAAQPVSPTIPENSFRQGLSGKIVFQSDRSGNGDIYAMNADGSNLTQLTDDPAADGYPVWSPDGAKIVFESRRDGPYAIYLMNADGSGQTRLTKHPSNNFNPEWSPDGQKIVFSSDRDGSNELYTMNVDGSAVSQVTDSKLPRGENGIAAWSPDGKRLAYTGKRWLGWDVYVMTLDHAEDRKLTDGSGACRPDWSPDGQKIAYVSAKADGKGDIWVMNPDGSGKTRVTTDDHNYDYYPAWSPDGKFIAYAKTPDKAAGNWELHVISADGKVDTPLTEYPARDSFPDWANGSIPTERVKPPRLVYEAEVLPRQIGQPQADPDASGGQTVLAEKTEKSGFLMYGPYKSYVPGDYVAHFRLKTDQRERKAPLAALDVAAAAGTNILAKKELTGPDFLKNNSYQEFQLPFTLKDAQTLEFRVYAFGKANLWADNVTVRPDRF